MVPLEVVELIQMVQSFLPAREAARTMVLSKLWLYAWSTSPSLRISCDTTSRSYIRTKWLEAMLISRHNYLSTLSVKVDPNFFSSHVILWVPPAVTNCVSLRVLELVKVYISQDVLDNLFSTCTLLEVINVRFLNILDTIKVRRLRFLRDLKIVPPREDIKLEIDDVPCLCSFAYMSKPWVSAGFGFSERCRGLEYGLAANSDSFASVRHLCLSKVIMNRTLLDTINSVFPFLESLTIDMECCWLTCMEITCTSLKRLKLVWTEDSYVNRDYASLKFICPSRLLFFRYEGFKMPILSFPTSALKEIEIILKLRLSCTYSTSSFFTRIWEAFNISSKVKIEVINMPDDYVVPYNINLNLKPATNVEEITFKNFSSKDLWDHSSSPFDAFISICHPKYVKVSSIQDNHSLKLVEEAMIKWTRSRSDLKDVEMKNDRNGRWETLKNAPISSSSVEGYGLSCDLYTYFSGTFKLNWKLVVEAMIKWTSGWSDLKDVEIKNDSNGMKDGPINFIEVLRCDPYGYTAVFKLNW
ncbi:uncharacterized protein [Rutidosis leptorrhynchoides]|uniref:uncharacterized protein n=1 Tax=Rutidosis leptorrhynchoides TaxID=125765 RepID=UPI003A98F130